MVEVEVTPGFAFEARRQRRLIVSLVAFGAQGGQSRIIPVTEEEAGVAASLANTNERVDSVVDTLGITVADATER